MLPMDPKSLFYVSIARGQNQDGKVDLLEISRQVRHCVATTQAKDRSPSIRFLNLSIDTALGQLSSLCGCLVSPQTSTQWATDNTALIGTNNPCMPQMSLILF